MIVIVVESRLPPGLFDDLMIDVDDLKNILFIHQAETGKNSMKVHFCIFYHRNS